MVKAGFDAASRPRPARLFWIGLVCPAVAALAWNHPAAVPAAFFLGVAAAIASVFRFIRHGARDAAFVFAAGMTLGCLAGGGQARLLEHARAGAYAALPEREVGTVEIVLDADSVLLANGTRLYTGDLVSVSARGGELVASAGGKIAVFAAGGVRAFWGEILRADGRFRHAADPGRAPFSLSAAPRGVSEAGFSHPFFAARRAALTAALGEIGRLGQPAASLFEALLLGVKDGLEFDLRDAFARTGSLHLLALSGLNVGMIAALIVFFLAPVVSRKAKTGLAALLVAAYYLLAGPSPSLTRAVLMLCLGATAYLLNREADPLHLLLVSAAIVIVLDPESVRSLSFQLSYAALLGILTLGRRLDRALVPFLPGFLRTLVAASLAAQVFTAPFVCAAYGTLHPVGLVVSLILVPLTTVYLWSGTVCLALNLVPAAFAGDFVRFVMDAQYRVIFAVSEFFKQAPGVSLVWQSWWWPPALVALACLAAGFRLQRRHELRFPVRA